ncbi:helix-turn-helix domain-containing protein [Nocardia neocaledoniensis]|uniref:AraC-like DNA-binding protein n=1 Tax=Nocardia neocaledoniensis TaxID=236511 RepID=A0A317P0B9_9NOCA|nr:AraC family transcriptional regulator [Nocardia neocaledoniensis]PWV80940.1 AraC-like DNA-binding protein [Nocardia neocaledoniensis]
MGAAPLPETCRTSATVWLWAGHALYRGPSLRLDRHAGAVACLAVGLDASFTIEADAIGARTVRSVLVPPRTPHRIVADGRMLFCYLDPGSPRAAACRARMREDIGGFGVAHVEESALIRRADTAPADLLTLASGTERTALDPRIAAATALLCADPAASISAADLAAAVHLSKSRLLHLFSAQAGTTFRRYRVWARMLAVGRAVAVGADLTTAAAAAGFASPSHFSDTFHALFGLTAADLLGSGARIVVEETGLLLPQGEAAR